MRTGARGGRFGRCDCVAENLARNFNGVVV